MILNILKALSDESRLRIFSILSGNELNVHEIQSILGMGQSRVSRHLKILTDSGLLECRKEGLWVFYRQSDGDMPVKFNELLSSRLREEDVFLRDNSALMNYMEKRDQQGREFFDQMASQWPDVRRALFGDFNLYGVIAGKVDLCIRIADLGCGDGELLSLVMEEGRKVIGIDRSSRMLDLAEERLARIKGGSFDLRPGELSAVPVRDGEVDCAVINMVLHYLDRPFEALKEASRILVAGGRLVIAELDCHGDETFRNSYGHRWLGFSQIRIERWLNKCGFGKIEMESFKMKEELGITLYSSIKNNRE